MCTSCPSQGVTQSLQPPAPDLCATLLHRVWRCTFNLSYSFSVSIQKQFLTCRSFPSPYRRDWSGGWGTPQLSYLTLHHCSNLSGSYLIKNLTASCSCISNTGTGKTLLNNVPAFHMVSSEVFNQQNVLQINTDVISLLGAIFKYMMEVVTAQSVHGKDSSWAQGIYSSTHTQQVSIQNWTHRYKITTSSLPSNSRYAALGE